VRRLLWEFHTPRGAYETVKLPWGLPIQVRPHEALGNVIRRVGIFELHECECISRLVDPGDLTVDAGANIGQMTSIMAVRAGSNGEVIAFEPHPVIFIELKHNIESWRGDSRAARIVAHDQALSNSPGTAQLVMPESFEGNRGTSFLADKSGAASKVRHVDVKVTTLDGMIEAGRTVGFLKMDVEGHELKVLEGARRLLESKAIRDVLFEEHHELPSPVTKFLGKLGYAIFHVDGGVWGPVVRPITTPFKAKSGTAPNYLATIEPDRLMTRMSKRGWTVFGRHN
jgi:FkbM family methyltransferase